MTTLGDHSFPPQPIKTIISEGDYTFSMNDIAEGPDGKIILSLDGALIVKVSKAVDQPIVRGNAEMMQWINDQIKELIKEAKIKLGAPHGS